MAKILQGTWTEQADKTFQCGGVIYDRGYTFDFCASSPANRETVTVRLTDGKGFCAWTLEEAIREAVSYLQKMYA